MSKSINTHRIAALDVASNVGLTIFKLLAGIFGHSTALISEAVHSGTDVLSALIAMLGVKISRNGPDKEHNYGHENFESIASMLLSVILFIAGIIIGYNGIVKIITANYGTPPTMIAIIAAVISVIVKAVMSFMLHCAAKASGSMALKAEAWHLRVDVLASLGCLLGVFGARFGLAPLDPIAAVIISLLIIKVAVSIFKDSLNKITDRACSNETEAEIVEIINAEPNTMGINMLKTRIAGSVLHIEAAVFADGEKSLMQAEDIRRSIESSLTNHFPKSVNCTVYMIPVDKNAKKD